MRRFRVEFGVLTAVLTLATAGYAADHDAVITGVVRDARGIPQMGALVQLLSGTDAAVRATTFTDLQGRYQIRSLLPGSYGIRATAAMFLPASQENLHLRPDHRSVVNLTLSGLLDSSLWLPARSKPADEASDDWNWTLRSSASRPILKLDEDGSVGGSGSSERRAGPAAVRVRAKVRSSSKSFGEGTMRAGVSGQRVGRSGTAISVESLAGHSAAGSETPMDLWTAVERPMGSAGLVSTRVSYASHPEINDGDGGPGLGVLSVSSAERFAVGDFAEVEAGSRIQAISGPASTIVTRPFLRVSTHPAAQWTVTYRLATAPDLQGYDGSTQEAADLPVAVRVGGRVLTEDGLHQEISVSHQTRATLLEVAYFADAMDRVALSGVRAASGEESGALPGDESAAERAGLSELLVDQSNGSFRALANGYRGSGLNILLTRAIGEHTWVALQYCAGTALAAGEATSTGGASARAAVQARRSEATTVSLKVNVARTGTKVRTSYRWQPGVLVSSVDAFDVLSAGGYLGFHVRQPLTLQGVLPEGFELTVDGTNVLGQGYRLVRGTGGPPMYLAAFPSSMQAGVAFNF